MPKVSIITPCFNSAKYLESTFNSVTSQTFTEWEWLIIDDCSTDNSLSIIENWATKDSRIKIFRNAKNSGASVTRNVGLEKSQRTYVAFLDSDDIWAQDKLEKQFQFMESTGANFSVHNYDIINSDGSFLKSMKSPEIISKATLLQFNPIFTSSVMMRKESIGEIRFKIELRRRQDYIFWFQAACQAGPAKNMGLPLGSYRVGNQESLSHNKLSAIPIQWKIYRNEFELNLLKSTQSLIAYAFHGIKKYFL